MMDDVTKSPYAEWLEGLIQQVLQHQPDRIGVVALIPGGQVLTGYYGEISGGDKAVLAYHMQTDAVLDAVFSNAKRIVEAAKEEEDEE